MYVCVCELKMDVRVFEFLDEINIWELWNEMKKVFGHSWPEGAWMVRYPEF